ncbi:hypothetical protein B0O99DRAFT_598316 [Bisporella sp. PMI_857]|nr:hypothetical protein B0O99DRAFT_598316 [Bisporella sp. PMI_857]
MHFTALVSSDCFVLVSDSDYHLILESSYYSRSMLDPSLLNTALPVRQKILHTETPTVDHILAVVLHKNDFGSPVKYCMFPLRETSQKFNRNAFCAPTSSKVGTGVVASIVVILKLCERLELKFLKGHRNFGSDLLKYRKNPIHHSAARMSLKDCLAWT